MSSVPRLIVIGGFTRAHLENGNSLIFDQNMGQSFQWERIEQLRASVAGAEVVTFILDYSGEGYFWLQRVIEGIVGLPFDVFAERELFDPLGMHHTSFVWSANFAEAAAWGHDGEDNSIDQATRIKAHSYANAGASKSRYRMARGTGTMAAHSSRTSSCGRRSVVAVLSS